MCAARASYTNVVRKGLIQSKAIYIWMVVSIMYTSLQVCIQVVVTEVSRDLRWARCTFATWPLNLAITLRNSFPLEPPHCSVFHHNPSHQTINNGIRKRPARLRGCATLISHISETTSDTITEEASYSRDRSRSPRPDRDGDARIRDAGDERYATYKQSSSQYLTRL